MAKQWLLRIESERDVANPSWPQIRSWLSQVDGDTLTHLALELLSEAALMVGGGENGRYVVTHFPLKYPNESTRTLCDSTLEGPSLELTVQVTSEFPARQCVYLPTMVQAFEYFFHHDGQLDPALQWESDC